HDRQIVSETFQRGVVPRPPDAIEKDIALADCGDESVLVQSRQEDAVVVGMQPEILESAVEPTPEKVRDIGSPAILDENKLAIGALARDARIDLIVLRQVFV